MAQEKRGKSVGQRIGMIILQLHLALQDPEQKGKPQQKTKSRQKKEMNMEMSLNVDLRLLGVVEFFSTWLLCGVDIKEGKQKVEEVAKELNDVFSNKIFKPVKLSLPSFIHHNVASTSNVLVNVNSDVDGVKYSNSDSKSLTQSDIVQGLKVKVATQPRNMAELRVSLRNIDKPLLNFLAFDRHKLKLMLGLLPLTSTAMFTAVLNLDDPSPEASVITFISARVSDLILAPGVPPSRVRPLEISLRGKLKFAGGLLCRDGFRTFRDNEGIERGENIKLELQRGTETLEGLSLCRFVSKEKNHAGTLMSSHNGKQDRSSFNEGNLSKRRRLGVFSWLSTGLFSSLTESFSPSNDVDFETDSFSRMRNLRLLQLQRVRLIGDYKYFPRELRWLCWRGFSSKSIPDRFPLENLVCLDMKHSSLKQVWKGIKQFPSFIYDMNIHAKIDRSLFLWQFLGLLKILDLSYSPLLELTPNFSGLANLERLSLRYCINLGEIHESIGELGRLLSLNLEGCNKLQKLPTSIGQLKSLKKLVLSGCSKLKDFPFDLGKMECLTVFHADGTSIYQSPTTTKETKSSSSIFWPWISKPAKTPEPIKFAMSSLCRSLVNLSLANCNLPNDAIPKDIGCLSSLQNLNLSGNQIHSLPESIKNLTMLKALELEGCKRLHSLPQLPSSITDLNLRNCKSLELVTNIPNLSSSLELVINNCSKLVEAH
ncbi:hypothetical protein LguiB_014435 [Lonicera macranthoides]